MSNPTTPFSWQMPTATDLVTDLPADFEVFGQAVATSMQDLLGGASGYILSKASATDMDFAWIANDQGDITGVLPGPGISGGGNSGAVTVTNSMATTITTKGDLVPGTGSGTFARLAAGNNGETLVADSSTATGLRYQSGYNGNAIINGGYDIWQRGTSIANTATFAYTADRWQSGSGTAQTTTRQASSLTGIQYCARVQRNSGSASLTNISLSYNLETADSYRFANQTITFSFYARKGTNYSAASSALGAAVISGTGTDQNVNAGFTGQTIVTYPTTILTTSWQRFQGTAAVSSSATQLAITFFNTPVGTAGADDYFEVTGVQLELGSIATQFKRSNGAGGTIQGELAACQRYYYRLTPGAVTINLAQGSTYSATVARVGLMYPVEMRIAPTALETNGTANNYAVAQAGIGSTTCSAIPSFNNASTRLATLNGIVASGLTTFQPVTLNTDTTNGATAYLGWSAEL